MKRMLLAAAMTVLPCVILASSSANTVQKLFMVKDSSQSCIKQFGPNTANDGPYCKCYAASAHQASGFSLTVQFKGLDSPAGLLGKTMDAFCQSQAVKHGQDPTLCKEDLSFVCIPDTDSNGVITKSHCYSNWIAMGCNIND